MKKFTLIELLVVIAIIAILAGILMPALSQARERAKAASCQSNLNQLALACRNYVDDHNDFWFYKYDKTDDSLRLHGWALKLREKKYVPAVRNTGSSAGWRVKFFCPTGNPSDYFDSCSEDNQPPYLLNSLLPTWHGGGGSLHGYRPDGQYAYGAPGFKSSYIKNPSRFAILSCKKYKANYTKAQNTFQESSQMSLRELDDAGTGKHKMNTDAHNQAGNHAFADGHVKAIPYTELRLELFMLMPELATEAGRAKNALSNL